MPSRDITQALLANGLQKHQTGNLAEAQQIYREILTLEPLHADALHLMGVIAHQTGHHNTAIEQIRRAIALKPSIAEFHNNLGEAYRALNRLQEAEAHYRQAISLKPDYVEPICNLGAMRIAQGRLEDAAACYRQALAIRPGYREAHIDLGMVLETQGRFDDAVACYRRAVNINPNDIQVRTKLGGALLTQGRVEQAIAQFRQVIALDPRSADGYNWLGACFTGLTAVEQAAVYYEKAIELDPSFAFPRRNLAGALRDQGKTDEAAAQYRRALELMPTDGLKILMATLLPVIAESKQHLLQVRRHYDEEVRRLMQEHLTLIDPVREAGATSFYLAYQGLDDRDLQCLMSKLYAKACPSLCYVADHCRGAQATPTGKIKVGFVSKYLWDHTIGKLVRGIIGQLSKQHFSTTLLLLRPEQDHVTEFLVRHTDQAIVVPADLTVARQMIAEEQLDILVYPEIGMDAFTYFLAFSRLAPVQCVMWGHPDTTGIAAIDYFISSEHLEPNGAERHYNERVIRLKHLPTYYYKPDAPPGKSRRDFGLEEDRVIYLCPQSLFKFHPEFDAVLAGILRAHPEGQVVIIEGQWSHFAELIRRRFQKSIPDVLDRIRVLPRQSGSDFLSLISLADVILDPLKWSGGNTTYEALSFGIPIVTMPSEFMRGRVTYACYKQMGVLDCVVSSEETYVQLAVRLGTDPGYRAKIKKKLLAANGVLYENASVVRELEQFFIEAAQKKS